TNPADGSVWFLSLYSRGYDVRRTTPPSTWVQPEVAVDPRLSPAVPLPSIPPPVLPANPVSASRKFDGRARLFRWVPQPLLGADGAGAALGLSSIDVVGRSELLATV